MRPTKSEGIIADLLLLLLVFSLQVVSLPAGT